MWTLNLKELILAFEPVDISNPSTTLSSYLIKTNKNK